MKRVKSPNLKVCRNLKSYFKEYCNASSIHGFRYFGENRTYIERGWWFIVFVICLSTCAYFISLVYMKWENSPVIVSFSTKETPIYKIPFPAVTICPETKSKQELYSHSAIVKKLINNEALTVAEYQQVSYMNLLCDFNISEPLLREYENNEIHINASFDNYFYANNEFFDFLYNVTPFPPPMLLKCRWMNKEFRCKDLFQAIMTDEGICYTFNMLKHSEIYKDEVLNPNIPFYNSNISQNVSWSLDEGYKEHEGLDTYPQRALFSGVKNALDLFLSDFGRNTDHICKFSFEGFKVSLHTPMRIPRSSQDYFRVPINEQLLASVQPVMITTTETVKVFKPEKRECYFQKEKPLKYFKRYSQRNCNLECLTDFTYDWCYCINFFMPRENGTDICGSLNKECMEEAEKILQQGYLSNILDKKRKRKNSTDSYIEEVPNCDCLPLCTDLSYNVETSSSRWEWKNMFIALNESLPIDELDTSVSRLIIYFKNSQFITSERHELYGPTDFLGNFGGLLGLFTGFSILSLIEIIYFLTVRIICNIRLYGNWSGCKKE